VDGGKRAGHNNSCHDNTGDEPDDKNEFYNAYACAYNGHIYDFGSERRQLML
jgi:hypothetical protein